MRYEWYIDVFFFVNFSMNLILLWLSGKILKRAVSWRRICAAAAAGAAIACAAVWSAFSLAAGTGIRGADAVLAAAGFTAPVIMARMAFRPGNPRELVKETLLLLFVSVCIGGLGGIFRDHVPGVRPIAGRTEDPGGMSLPALGFTAAGAVFLFWYLWLTASEIRREREVFCLVTLRVGEKRLEAAACRDSGNSLTEPESGAPVSVVSERVWKELLAAAADGEHDIRIRRIPYRTVGNPFGIMEAMQIDSIEECGRVRRGQNRLPPAGSAAAAGGDCRPWVARAPFPVSQDGSYDVLLQREL